MTEVLPPPRGTFYTLDLLRGVAACMVMLGHMEALPIGTRATYLSVDLFLLLSGVVITRAYEPRLAAGMGVGAFMVQRVIRLWPLYALGLVLGMAVCVIGYAAGGPLLMGRLLPLQAAQALLFLPNPPGAMMQAFPINPPAWTLFMELVVNLLFAVGLFRLRPTTLAGLAALVLCLLIWSATRHQANEAGLNLGGMAYQVWPALLRCLFSFLVGMVLFRLWSRRRSRLFGSHANGVALFCVAAYLMVVLITPAASPRSLLWDLLVVTLAWPPLVLLALACEPDGAMRRASAFSGLISYPVYMIHFPALGLTALLGGGSAHLSIGAAVLLVVAVTVVAWWLGRVFDPRARMALDTLVGRLARPMAKAAPHVRH